MKIYLEKLKWEVLSPYSPDIASSDYHLLRSMAHGLAEQHIHSYEHAKKCVNFWIASKDVSFFQCEIQMLKMGKMVSDGQYFQFFLNKALIFTKKQ